MYRTLKPIKDCYITDKVVKSSRKTAANTGKAATIDIFKLYDITRTGTQPNIELSRGLIQFDLSDLITEVSNGKINISDPSFRVRLKLIDVYGGQPNPSNFTLSVFPLSRSFDEGNGKDIVFFQDSDICNFFTASYINGVQNLWFLSGANSKGQLGASNIDVIQTANLQDGLGLSNLFVTQSFLQGTENLDVDVTRIVSATITGQIPNCGFRISFQDSEENDQKTRFVKRFGSSNASDPYVRPTLVFYYNDSVISDDSNFTFDTPNTLYLKNYVKGNLKNLVSGTSMVPISGLNSLLLKLITRVSSSAGFSSVSFYATGSQQTIGSNFVTGVYKATITIPSATPSIASKINQSGSINFDQVWCSLDESISYFSGTIEANLADTSTDHSVPRRYYVNVTNINQEYSLGDVPRLNVFFFDFSAPSIKLVNIPIETPSVIVQDAYYSVRDVITNYVVIPFDLVYNSTKLSGDSQTMFFDLWMSSLIPGRSYVIDILVNEGGKTQVYRDVSPAFRVMQS